jgi:hypothetical protein
MLLAAAAVVALACSAAPAGAKVVAASSAHARLGFFPSIGYAKAHPTACTTSCSALLLHSGGKVMHGQKLYSIFWSPRGYYIPAEYKLGLNQWVNDFASASYGPSNVFSVAQQYYDLTGPASAKSFVPYAVSNGGYFTDTNAYPANGCTDSTLTKCLNDTQLRAEIQKFVTTHSLPQNANTEYLLYTPKGVGSCFTSSSTSCAYAQYCAYHGSITTTGGQIVYSNMPWTYQTSGCDAQALWGFGYANGSSIDPEVGVLSHEIIESMTDPNLNAWYDSSLSEIGDKCAYNYDGVHYGSGTTGLPNNGLGLWNQAAGGSEYLMQTEFSNHNSNGSTTGCVGKNTDTQPVVTVSITPAPHHGSSSQFKVNVTDPAGVSTVQWSFGDGVSATGTPVNHTYATAGTKSLSVIVTDGHGNQKRVLQSVSVS